METLRGHSDEVKKTSNKNGGNTKWKWTLWRCVSYWSWWYCIAMLVYQRVYHIWVVVLKIFCFKLYLGKIPILTNVVQMGWFKHQLQSTMVIKLPTSAGIKQCNCMLPHWIHEWLIIMVNVGKYTNPMDPMGEVLVLYMWMLFWFVNVDFLKAWIDFCQWFRWYVSVTLDLIKTRLDIPSTSRKFIVFTPCDTNLSNLLFMEGTRSRCSMVKNGRLQREMILF